MPGANSVPLKVTSGVIGGAELAPDTRRPPNNGKKPTIRTPLLPKQASVSEPGRRPGNMSGVRFTEGATVVDPDYGTIGDQGEGQTGATSPDDQLSDVSAPAGIAADDAQPLLENGADARRSWRNRKASEPSVRRANDNDTPSPDSLRSSASRSRLPYHPTARIASSHRLDSRATLMATRYRYYQRLDPRSDGVFRLPDHMVPDSFFSILPFTDFTRDGRQSSWITVFSIWNTMMGTSLLSMPWALNQAGLLLGIFFMLLMASVSFYTCYRVVQSPKGLPLSPAPDFVDVCRFYWGRTGVIVSMCFSIVVLLGAVIVYWVLMSNFLYYTGMVFHEASQPNSTEFIVMANSSLTCDVTCVGQVQVPVPTGNSSDAGASTTFDRLWGLQTTVPFYLAIIAFPLFNFKSPTFFTKFNVFAYTAPQNLLNTWIITIAVGRWTFPSLTGTLALSFFIHNAIMAILRNQRHPENNVRDLALGFGLTAVTYTYIALVFFGTFPLVKDCIADNLLNNFGTADALSSVARVFLLFQMLCVLPLIMYIIRAQLFASIMNTVYPGLPWVLALNLGVVGLCIIFAVFMPTVGTIIRFTGSIAGLVYIFALPSLVHLKGLQRAGRMTNLQIALHALVVFAGFLNLIAQFAIL